MEAAGSKADDENSGLKLGKRTYLEDGGTEGGSKPPPATPTTPTQAAATPCWKKGRGSPQANVTPKCQVEGCKADLAGAKDYHRRHKVCEVHSKTPKNTVNGQEQRFCQQCSRFHLLAEFDEGKRSCRRRLAGHNERRRKPQPDALAAYSMGNGSSFQASYQRLGSSIIVDGHGEAIAYGGGSWGRLGHQQLLGKQLPENLSAEKLLMLLQNSKRTTTAASMAKKDQIGLTLSSSSPGGGMSHSHSHGVTSVPDSSRALSLLSSEPWSPTHESPSSVSYGLSAANNSNNSTQYLMIGGDVSSAVDKKFQQQSVQAQARDAIPISSGSSNKGQQPYASPIMKSFEDHPNMLALMQGQALHQARPAIDLMQAPSSQQQKHSSPGTTQYMHTMKPFESPVFESQQML